VCWFVTLAVPQRNHQAMEHVAEGNRAFHFTHLASTPTTRLFPVNASCIEITHGGCSCDFYSAPVEAGREENDAAREHRRLVRKGWSPSKIERHLQSKMESALRPTLHRKAVAAFNTLIADLVARLGTLELFAHFYNGNQREEAVSPRAPVPVTLAVFLEAGFPPDTIVTVRAAGQLCVQAER
jgi:hypothetical protein